MLRFVPRSDRVFTEKDKAKLRPYTGVLASLLFARGMETAADAERFLNPDLSQLHDPFLLSDMQKAVVLIDDAKRKNEKAVVYGDYDTDGVCAAALLTEALRAYGVDATPYLPLRDDGYGLNADAVEELSKTYRLLITVDLGITNADEVALAKRLGMAVIVTDHHQPGLVPCPADAVVNPLLNNYPFPYLCGAGVAYKLAEALFDKDTEKFESTEYLPLAAVATIADIVTLTGENRVIAALGLPLIPNRPGLRALMETAELKPPVSEGAVGFQLAPRLNAAGRVGDANAAVRLLMTADKLEAQKIASELDAANTQRKRLEQAAVNEAMEQAKTHNFVEKHVLFVRGKDWHKGVIGLAAGRLNRVFSVPVCALSEEDGMLHGSLRGVPGVNLAACLKQCDDLLVKYGGHEMAAGVTLADTQYAAFCARLEAAVRATAEEDAFVPAQIYDLPLNLEDANFDLLHALGDLRPVGQGNPAPVFYTAGARLESRRACGAGGAHLQLRLRQNKAVLSGIAFGKGAEADTLPDEVDVAFSLERNVYLGREELQCQVAALRPDGYAAKRALHTENDALYHNALIARLTGLAGKQTPGAETITSVPAQKKSVNADDAVGAETLLAGRQGTLYVAYTRDTAVSLYEKLGDRVDVAVASVSDPRCFHTLLLRPVEPELLPHWKHVVLLDGALSPADRAAWQAKCPNAVLLTSDKSPALRNALAALDAGDSAYRELYRLLRASAFRSLAETARTAGLPEAQTLTGLTAFHQLGLIRLSLSPFSYALLPADKCSLSDSPLLQTIRTISSGKEEAGC